jgi:hypothetical protein
MLKKIVGRLFSWIGTLAFFAFAVVRTILDVIGYTTAQGDAAGLPESAQAALLWLLSIPWWIPWAVFLGAFMWLAWWSWTPHQSEMKPQEEVVKRKAATTPLSSQEETAARVMIRDHKKADFIAELYPLIQEFSDTHVDHFGDKLGDWREAFTNELSQDWFAMVSAELQSLSAHFDQLRGMFSSHRFYEDIYLIDDEIAQRINAIGTAMAPVREVARRLSYKFDENSVGLVDEPMKAVSASIGQLRSYLSPQCLEELAAMRRQALG